MYSIQMWMTGNPNPEVVLEITKNEALYCSTAITYGSWPDGGETDIAKVFKSIVEKCAKHGAALTERSDGVWELQTEDRMQVLTVEILSLPMAHALVGMGLDYADKVKGKDVKNLRKLLKELK